MEGLTSVDKMLLEHDCNFEWKSLGRKCQRDYGAACPSGKITPTKRVRDSCASGLQVGGRSVRRAEWSVGHRWNTKGPAPKGRLASMSIQFSRRRKVLSGLPTLGQVPTFGRTLNAIAASVPCQNVKLCGGLIWLCLLLERFSLCAALEVRARV